MTDTFFQFDFLPLTNSMLSGMYSLTDWMEPLFAAEPTLIEKWSGYAYNASRRNEKKLRNNIVETPMIGAKFEREPMKWKAN
jgi:hypothetical protein